jgi:c-di-GMP-binding flagellar brake protein YcgR
MSSNVTVENNYPGSDRGSDEQELIVEPVRITYLLNKVMDNRSALELTIQGGSDRYYSSLLDIDAVQGVLLIDELVPIDGNHRLVLSKKLFVRATLEGIILNFQSVLCHQLRIDNYTGYEIRFPNILYYRQRRKFFRAVVGLYRKISVQFRINDYRRLTCQLRNISSGGMMIKCEHRLPDWLETGSEFSDWIIQLYPDTRIALDIRICFIQHLPSGHGTLLGVKFRNLKAVTQQQIDQLVAELNRDLVRKVLLTRESEHRGYSSFAD